jgi:WW domain-containing oxidoreductase
MTRKLDRRRFVASAAAAAVLMAATALPARAAPRRFTSRSTAEEVTSGIELDGRLALVTGATSGIGLETARVLALRGARVIACGRTPQRAVEACATLPGQCIPLALDLADFDSVRAASRDVLALDSPLDILVCNAGIMAPPRLELAYGLERQFVVNHLGHFLLANRLLAPLRAASQGRVVVIGSRAHRWSLPEGLQFDNLDGSRGYDPRKFYGQSKLANGLFALELSRRLGDSPATANTVHPGVILTNILRYLPGWQQRFSPLARPFTKSVAQGAATPCWVATAPELASVSGGYFADCRPAVPAAEMTDPATARRLWALSEEWTGAWL